MKTAIIGYGKMGREIESILKERGHDVALIIDADNPQDLNEANLASIDVALEFSTPTTAYQNIVKCLSCGVAVVSGTTGWLEKRAEVESLCAEKSGAFFYASNYSIGVNIMFEINARLAKIMNKFNQYDATISEVHHTHKLDSPSGTAITLAEGVLDSVERKECWVNDVPSGANELEIKSFREGEVIGIHTVTYDSPTDVLTLHHELKTRRALAMGAVIASEFVCGKQGLYSMSDLMK